MDKQGRNKKIALFGGSFNPWHKGHQMIIDELCQISYFDEIWVIPNFNNPLKKQSPDFKKRFENIKKQLNGKKNVKLLTIEHDNKYEYTIETINHFKKNHPEFKFTLVIGDDILTEIRLWKNYQQIIKNTNFFVFNRNNNLNNNILLNEFKDKEKIFSKAELLLNNNDNYIFIYNNNQIDISSTEIRMKQKIEEIKNNIVKELDLNKGIDIVDIDLAGKSTLADYMVIASANNSRHALSLARKADEVLAKSGIMETRLIGKEEGNWVILDNGDVIVHIFREEVREYYDLDTLWTKGFEQS